MELEKFLANAAGQGKVDEGVFTLAAERAKRLLAEQTLNDPWHSWLCLFQGLQRCGIETLAVETKGRHVYVEFKPKKHELGFDDLLADDRFLLGWLNLDFFGQPFWDQERQGLRVELKGSIFTRYNLLRNLKSLVESSLAYCGIEVTYDGKSLAKNPYPSSRTYTLYHSRPDRANHLKFTPKVAELSPDRLRILTLGDDSEPTELDSFSAVCFRSRKSWSQVQWVCHGVVIKQERNTLERPGLFIIASVENIGLKTDFSGFEIVHDDDYFAFVGQVKRDCLWML